jgi:FtsP/CotA-like multicopper oxidase with cupredoxin domain
MKRRDFLKLGYAGVAGSLAGGAGLIAWSPRSQAATLTKTLYITDGLITQPDGVDVYFRGFSASPSALDVPGELLTVQVGDAVQITVLNTLDTTHQFTVAGLGVSTITIGAGQTETLSFTAGTPGTFMYLDPSNEPYNRLVGLHGALAVMPASGNELFPGSRTFVQQYCWVFNDIDPAWHRRIANGQTPNTPYVPRYFTLNGLSGRPPGATGAMDPSIDSMADPRSKLDGHLGDRTLIRCVNAGQAQHAVHTHGNHMEWLSRNGQSFSDIWEKDIVPLDGNGGRVDVVFPFDPPPDAWPPVTNATLVQAEAEQRHFAFPMHLHDEMTQTAGGGLYMFGALTDIYYHAD